MKITVDQDSIEKKGLSVDEFLVLMMMNNHYDIGKAIDSLIEKGFIIKGGDNFYFSGFHVIMTDKGNKVFSDVVLDDDNNNTDPVLDLAVKLKEIYPKGKKDGRWYYAEGVKLIARRLKIFFKKYGNYKAEDIINATQKYVDEKRDAPDFRLLKYFIFKEAVGAHGEVEPSSDLLTYIENKNEVEDDPDWILHDADADTKEEKDIKFVDSDDPFKD